jgi:8-oxo-dGTP pyrophosphatase MutT (NUDIX family)
VTAPTRIAEIAELDFRLELSKWTFARVYSAAIASHWEQLRRRNPALYNGRILLLGRRELKRRADGELTLRGVYFEADFADFVAWRDFGFPGDPVENCFSMAALRSADGAFLLGEMASHTLNAGKVYFPAGTPDRSDVFDGKVDLDASARRELLEETGVSAETAAAGREWTVVFAGQRIACMKEIALPIPAEEAKARIDAFLALDPNAELRRMHIIRQPDDVDSARTPDFVAAYIRAKFDGRAE